MAWAKDVKAKNEELFSTESTGPLWATRLWSGHGNQEATKAIQGWSTVILL